MLQNVQFSLRIIIGGRYGNNSEWLLQIYDTLTIKKKTD